MKDLLSKEENLRLAIADHLNYDLEKSEAVCDFVLGKKRYPVATPSTPSVEYPDGVYYVMNDHSLILANEDTANTYCQSIIGVAAKMGSKIATVALHDVNGGEEIALTKEGKSGSPNFYHKDSWDAITDWNGEANTKDLGDMLNPNIELKEGDYIPSLAQLHLILMNIKEVNKALEAVGGTLLRKTWYWSSTEYSTTYSWFMYFIDGVTYSTYKSYQYVVRPSVAYRL